MAVSGLVVMHWWCPRRLRIWILRAFGAEIGNDVLIRHRVRIHWPWKLSVGNSSWIGEGAWILNLESVSIGNDVCISQDALICTGSHDFNSSTFEFDNGRIFIEDGVWIAARATILRGVRIGENSLIGATALVASDTPAYSRVLGPHSVSKKRSEGHE
ncbi:putative colanic acid biosynthesis acetyltransferase [Rhodococcus wratislaviensis]|uniref:putative colanic acid biosynthesis acetyltransferase n=2 Tax=Rhodococcus wratislaviensis TaxID=44752 RepID=UPI000E2589F3